MPSIPASSVLRGRRVIQLSTAPQLNCRSLGSRNLDRDVVKLPSADRTVIDDAKIRDYLLSSTHPIGRSKARFIALLGYSQEEWQRLRDDLLEMARTADSAPSRASAHGEKFEIHAIQTRTRRKSSPSGLSLMAKISRDL